MTALCALLVWCGVAAAQTWVGLDGATPVRLSLEVHGRRAVGTLTRAGEAPLAARGRVGATWRIQAAAVELGCAPEAEALRCAWTEAGQTRSVVLGDGIDPAVVGLRAETWRRPGTHKPSQDIPVSLPLVWVADVAAQQNLDRLLAPEALLGSARAELEADGWVDQISTEVGFSAGGLLNLVVTVEGSGPYPDQYTVAPLIDLHAGARVGAEVFAASQQDALLARLEAMLQRNIGLAVGVEPEIAPLLQDRHVGSGLLSQLRLRPEGVVFSYDYGLPHAVAAAAPDGELFLGWGEILPYLAPDTPLAGLARAEGRGEGGEDAAGDPPGR